MNNSMSFCMLQHMLRHIDDEEIRDGVQLAYDLSSHHFSMLQAIMNEENFALPTGFSAEDVNLNAPKLYSDTFCMMYVNHMAKVGMLQNSASLSLSVRTDIRNHFTSALHDVTNLYNKTTEIAVGKGIFVRAPYIMLPIETDYIDSKKYLNGSNPFSNPRPLNAIEISHLYMNIQTNYIGAKLATSFAQTSQTLRVQEYMLQGKELSNKHVKIFSSALVDNDTIVPGSPDVCITYSTTSIFSDKLMMFHMSFLGAAGIGNYETAAAASQRNDLVLSYERLSLEIAKYAKDDAYLMLQNNWLEQPPGTKDKDKLAKEKE
jgi:hypothetical protein